MDPPTLPDHEENDKPPHREDSIREATGPSRLGSGLRPATVNLTAPESLDAMSATLPLRGVFTIAVLAVVALLSSWLPARIYRRMIAVAVLIGLPLVLIGVWRFEASGWAFETSFFGNKQYNWWGSIAVALGWIGAVMLFCQRPGNDRLKRALAATGQMALTNYLLQTIICTTLFYGHGLGLFGRVERPAQIAIVAAVLALQLVLSPWWLARFRFGPCEWLWRSLTYLKIQPLRR